MSAPSNPYTFQRASTMATHSLVTDTNPATDNSNNNPTTTDNYSSAAANAAKIGTTGTGAVAAGGADRPGFLERQPSWKMSDKKRQVAEQMLSGEQPNSLGYHSAGH